MNIRTRFSPSPTGMIHLGNARAALFSALYAAKHQGVFILRVEDTDVLRSDEQYMESLQEDLALVKYSLARRTTSRWKIWAVFAISASTYLCKILCDFRRKKINLSLLLY